MPLPASRPSTSRTTKIAMAMKNSSLAMPAAAPYDHADDDFAEEPDFEVNDG